MVIVKGVTSKMNQPAVSYMPFFLTGFFPCFLVLVGMYMNNKRFDRIEVDIVDIKSQIQHFIDLHIGHGDRISKIEERTKNL
jgi:hypothetical protein